MIFKDSTKIESYYFPFNWGVDYTDNTSLTEFDLINNNKNDFYSIEQHKVNRFGLYGHGMKFYCNKDGSFILEGQHIEIEYHLDDKIYPLTISFNQKDYISYKQKEMWYDKNLSLQEDEIVSIDFGYKTLITYDNTQFFFQPIVSLPINQTEGKVSINVKMTSNLDLNGKLVFKNNGKIMDTFDYPLKRNYSSKKTWIVK